MSAVTNLIGTFVGARSARKQQESAEAMQQKALDATAYQGKIATDQYDDYTHTYRPLEHELVQQAEQADSPEAYDKAAADAQATVSSQIGAAQDRLARTPGMDPTSAAATAAQTDLALHGAALGAGEQNRARAAVKEKAFAQKLDVAGLGKGLVTSASTGMANAAAQSAALAKTASANAVQTAAGTGALIKGIGDAVGKINFDWGASPATPSASETTPEGFVNFNSGAGVSDVDPSTFATMG